MIEDETLTSGPAARVLVLSDEPLQRESLCALLRNHGGYETIPVAELQRAGRLHDSGRPCALAWFADRVTMPALEPVLALRAAHPDLGLVLVATRIDARLLAALLQRPGNRLALIDRTSSPSVSDLLNAVGQVLRGRASVDSGFVGQLVEPRGAAARRLDRLSPTEREVVVLLADGLRNGEIARRLARSEKSIEKHVSRVFEKFGLGPARSQHLDRRVMAARVVLEARDGVES